MIVVLILSAPRRQSHTAISDESWIFFLFLIVTPPTPTGSSDERASFKAAAADTERWKISLRGKQRGLEAGGGRLSTA